MINFKRILKEQADMKGIDGEQLAFMFGGEEMRQKYLRGKEELARGEEMRVEEQKKFNSILERMNKCS